MGEIWVVRHGETEWSANGRHTGLTEVPLTEVGEEQARGLIFRLNREWATVRSSPLSRSVRTAKLAGFAPVLDPDLVEWDYGAAEGRTTAELSTDKPWSVWDDPLGEPLEALAARVRHVLDSLPEGDALLFAHGHVLRVLTVVYLGLPPIAGRHLMLDAARVGVLAHEHGTPTIRAWNL